MLTSIDGVISATAQATVPVGDEGFLRGDGAFEVIRRYGGKPLAFDEHLERLGESAAGLQLATDLPALRAEAEALMGRAPGEDGLLRLVVTRGGRRIAMLEPLPTHKPAIELATVQYEPSVLLDGVKSLSYAANMLATRIARDRGADEALLVTPAGDVLEAPTSALFWVAGGRLLTPPLGRILRSITRRLVVEAAGAHEQACTRADLEAAEEAFLASTTREVHPVAAIDGRAVPSAPGPVTQAAAAALRVRIEQELAAA